MRTKQIDVHRLVSALERSGFVKRRQMGSHSVFLHAETGLIVTVPTGTKTIPVTFLTAILRQIVDRGIMSKDEFLRLLK